MTRPTTSSPGRREPDTGGEHESGPALLTDADRLHAALDAALTATTRHQGNSD